MFSRKETRPSTILDSKQKIFNKFKFLSDDIENEEEDELSDEELA